MARAPGRRSGSGGAGARARALPDAKGYVHADKEMQARPEIGAAPRFRAKKPPTSWRYDSSLSPALDFDTSPARETGAFLLDCIEAAAALPPPHLFPERRVLKGADGSPLIEVAGLQDALARLRRMQRPFLDWAGKAERQTFEVPTLPLFVHERLSTAAIVKTLEGHRRQAAQAELDLFADPQRPMADQVRAYEYRDRWVNRMILGDSLVVMNSLLRFEGLGGQVQSIYIDPPYGVKFGSNFQPFVRKRDVSHGDDADMTREPEMVQAYRDTWELGLHSYLTYLRDRLLVARELLAPSGSVFVQISDDNFHHVRSLMDEVMNAENFVVTIPFKKKGNQRGELLDPINDYLVWFARDKERLRQTGIDQLFEPVPVDRDAIETFSMVELADGTTLSVADLSKQMNEGTDYALTPERIAKDYPGARLFASEQLTNEGVRKNQSHIFQWSGRPWDPGLAKGKCWKHTAVSEDGSPSGMQRIADAKRLYAGKNQLRYRRYLSDFGYRELSNWWDAVGGAKDRVYVVQTNAEIIKRCLLMTTDPGDLVLDPTCGSGTTAYVAEQWGRRWITIDTSRVPLALARQRLLSATYPWYRLRDEAAGPGSGFVYARRQNRKGEEVGGIVPHITSSTIANNEPPAEEVLVDRPEENSAITRVAGPFVVEATLPTPADVEAESPHPDPLPLRSAGEGEGVPAAARPPADSPGDHIQRMIEVLRKSPSLALPGNRRVTLKTIRRPARSLALSAEARMEDGADTAPVAILFGPADGPVTAKAVLDAAKEANVKGFHHLFVIGFAITADARAEISGGEAALGLTADYVTATMDLQMGDLLKTSRASQIFAVCGLPEIAVSRLPEAADDGTPRWQVKLLGLDVFDPVEMTTDHRKGNDVPCWMLDQQWNGLVFHADQVFFPRTGAWDNLKRALRATHDEAVWDHLKGDTSAPFAAPAGTDIAVKVFDDRGNELAVYRKLGS